jgi:polyisoprenoid-binding protein YceI
VLVIRKTGLVIGASALVSAAAIAQMPAMPGVADPARVTAGTYRADAAHTLVSWTVDHFGFSDYFGLFGDVTGTLTIDPANPSAAKVDVTIPINPTVASAGLRDHLLRPGKDGKAPDFFGPEPSPARFVSRSVTVGSSGTSAYILGDLTLNGVTRPVAIQAEFTGAGANPINKAETIGFSGRSMIKRSDFGINYAIPMVSDEVELTIAAAFEKTSPGDRPEGAAGSCNAGKIAPWVGEAATPAVRAEVLKATGARAARWLYPDSAVTMDYRPDRLNVTMDKGTDVIRSARCG